MSHERLLTLSSSSGHGTRITNFLGTTATLFKSDDFADVNCSPRPMELKNECRILLTLAPEDILDENHSSKSATPSSALLKTTPVPVSSYVREAKEVGSSIFTDRLPTDKKLDALGRAQESKNAEIRYHFLVEAIMRISRGAAGAVKNELLRGIVGGSYLCLCGMKLSGMQTLTFSPPVLVCPRAVVGVGVVVYRR